MGMIHSRDQAWEQAEKDYRQAFQLNPNLSAPHMDYASFVLCPLGRLQEAEQELHTALKFNRCQSQP